MREQIRGQRYGARPHNDPIRRRVRTDRAPQRRDPVRPALRHEAEARYYAKAFRQDYAGSGWMHFHDLRREAGSRWMDAGVLLHTIQKWLGHANISQTSTYLRATHGATRTR